MAQGLQHVHISMGSESYLPALASTCTPLEFTPAPALAPPTFALTPMSHCDLQHFSESCLQEPRPNEQHPALIDAMATAITTAIRFTFMAYLTFFNSVLPETISGSDSANLTPFFFCRQWGISARKNIKVDKMNTTQKTLILTHATEHSHQRPTSSGNWTWLPSRTVQRTNIVVPIPLAGLIVPFTAAWLPMNW